MKVLTFFIFYLIVAVDASAIDAPIIDPAISKAKEFFHEKGIRNYKIISVVGCKVEYQIHDDISFLDISEISGNKANCQKLDDMVEVLKEIQSDEHQILLK